MKQSDDNHIIPMTSIAAGKGHLLTPDLYYYTNQIVNFLMLSNPGRDEWVLVDAGMPGSAGTIIDLAKERFPDNPRPQAIILTHGHFDHVGGLVKLLNTWNVPVYAHTLEFPFLTGQQSYPEPDPTVEGGMLAKISSIYPHEPIDISPALVPLPADGSMPFSWLREWRWLHTPGHSPGHVSFFRDRDRALIAGDAFTTVRTDEFYKVLVNKTEVNGPPRYLTTDWTAAKDSVYKLYRLNPSMVITGHGSSMEGQELERGLEELVATFDETAVPRYGKYVDRPA